MTPWFSIFLSTLYVKSWLFILPLWSLLLSCHSHIPILTDDSRVLLGSCSMESDQGENVEPHWVRTKCDISDIRKEKCETKSAKMAMKMEMHSKIWDDTWFLSSCRRHIVYWGILKYTWTEVKLKCESLFYLFFFFFK